MLDLWSKNKTRTPKVFPSSQTSVELWSDWFQGELKEKKKRSTGPVFCPFSFGRKFFLIFFFSSVGCRTLRSIHRIKSKPYLSWLSVLSQIQMLTRKASDDWSLDQPSANFGLVRKNESWEVQNVGLSSFQKMLRLSIGGDRRTSGNVSGNVLTRWLFRVQTIRLDNRIVSLLIWLSLSRWCDLLLSRFILHS